MACLRPAYAVNVYQCDNIIAVVIRFCQTATGAKDQNKYQELSLACSIGKQYGFPDFGVVQEVFSGRIRRENGVRMHGVQLDALFRLKGK